MDFSLEFGKEVLRQTPGGLQAMLSDLSEDWIAGDEGPTRGRLSRSSDTSSTSRSATGSTARG